MKFIIVTIRRESDRVPMKYPAAYNAQEMEGKKRGPYIRDGGIGAGQDSEEMLALVVDEHADKLALDPDIRILTRAEADTWLGNDSRLAKQPTEIASDPERLAMIRTKVAAGIALSQEDLDALDPDSPIRGITRKTRDVNGHFPDFR